MVKSVVIKEETWNGLIELQSEFGYSTLDEAIARLIKSQHPLLFQFYKDYKAKEKCEKCGAVTGLVYHHIVPLNVGGSNDVSNIQVLCVSCHRAIHKGTRRSFCISDGRTQAHKLIIKYLRDRNCFSMKTSTVSIDELVKAIGEQLDRSKGLARYYYLQLKGASVIESRKYQHSSKVWLNKELALKSDLLSAV